MELSCVSLPPRRVKSAGVGNFHDLTAAEALNSSYYELTCYDGHVYTAPVGSLSANAFGLHDVLGNVGESVEDCGHQNYAGAPTDGTAWTAGGDCSTRVIRGGEWAQDVSELWTAEVQPDSADKTLRKSYYGFRLVRTL